jgi:Bacterial RNA polymerase, alpha chain C terminal domain
MRRIQLPNGTYLNPAEIGKFEIKKHFFSRQYSVPVCSRSGSKIGAVTGLALTQAEFEKGRYQDQLEARHEEISAYEEGHEAGSDAGRKFGYEAGYGEGHRIGFESGQHAGWNSGCEAGLRAGRSEGYDIGLNEGREHGRSAGISAVLDQLGCKRSTLIDEMRYGTHLVESRRESIFAMINLIDSITAVFIPPEPEPEPDTSYPNADELVEVAADSADVRPGELPFNRNLLRKVAELELSVHTANCLKDDNIVYIGDLAQKSEAEMLRTPNFGRKSLNEIKETLAQMGLHLGMEIPDWPPENIETLSDR